MKKVKRVFRRIFTPIPCSLLLVLACLIFSFTVVVIAFAPSFLSDPSLLESVLESPYPLDQSVTILGAAGVISGFLYALLFQGLAGLTVLFLNWFWKRREGPESVKDNRLELYFNDCTYERLEQCADMAGNSVADFCSAILSAVEPEDVAAARVTDKTEA